MAQIQADNQEIASVLSEIIKIVEASGGELHKDIILKIENGDLSINAPECAPGERILHIPQSVLLPVKEMDIKLKEGKFDVSFKDKYGLTPEQRDLTMLIFELYNLTDKGKFHKRTNFWLKISKYPELMDTLLQGRTMGLPMQKVYESAKQGFSDRNIDEYICHDFIKSRVLAYKIGDSNEGVKVIMPIIDFLNHHWQGSNFQTVDKKELGGGISVLCRKPLANKGNSECFASYRPMDGLDTLVGYGFVDRHAPYVRSIPVDIKVPNHGKIIIKSRMDLFNNKKLAKKISDLRLFMPILQKHYDMVTASHVFIPAFGAPLALRRILIILLGRLIGAPLERKKVVDFLRPTEQFIIDKNLEYYENLARTAQKIKKKSEPDDILDEVIALTDIHKEKINLYRCLPEKNEAA